MISITHIRTSPVNSQSHQHITHVYWDEVGTNSAGWSTRQEVVDWIQSGVDARVSGSPFEAKVVVVAETPPYLRTVADGFYGNNLLSLPRM